MSNERNIAMNLYFASFKSHRTMTTQTLRLCLAGPPRCRSYAMQRPVMFIKRKKIYAHSYFIAFDILQEFSLQIFVCYFIL